MPFDMGGYMLGGKSRVMFVGRRGAALGVLLKACQSR